MAESKKKSIYQKVLDIAKDLGAVEKSGKMEFGQTRYNYRKLDDLVNELQPLLIKHGVIIVPSVKEVQHDKFSVDKRDYKSGVVTQSTNFKATVVIEYTFVDADSGDKFTVSAIGEGLDSGDKASYKAMAGCLKYALSYALMIPTEEDPDKENLKVQVTVNAKPEEPKTPVYKDPLVAPVQDNVKVRKIFALAKQKYPEKSADDFKEMAKRRFQVSSFTMIDNTQLDKIIEGLEKVES
jgi:hypothetical protein